MRRVYILQLCGVINEGVTLATLFHSEPTVVTDKSDNFSFKLELPTCIHPPSITPLFLMKEGAKQVALILMKNSHFNRTPL